MKSENEERVKSVAPHIPVTTLDVEKRTIILRNQPVFLDCDVAELYGVRTKEVNQAVRNNKQKFPPGYIFQLDQNEKEEVVKIFDHLNRLKFSKVAPIGRVLADSLPVGRDLHDIELRFIRKPKVFQ